MSRLFVGAAVLALALSGTATAAPSVKAGRLVAQRYCGACHAVAKGASPLADAPPFRTLHSRYGEGGLEALLDEGMLADRPRPLEEGTRPPHPRMPSVNLGGDEAANLIAYLHSLEPHR